MQPKREDPSNADTLPYMRPSENTGEIMLDVPDDVTTVHNRHTGRLGDMDVDIVELEELWEPNEEGGYAVLFVGEAYPDPPWTLSLDAGNYITCEGDMPSFPLPQPYLVSDFQNPQELCAVQWSGGLSGANAGGYCHRSNPHGPFGSYEYENYVWFSDEMTPCYEYTWGGGDFFLASSLRTYCYAHCYCNSVGKDHTSRRRWTTWQFLRNHELVLHGDGSMDYGRRGPLDQGIYNRIASVLPPQTGAGGGNAAGTCGADGKQFCLAPWPLAEFGPIPRAPPYSTEISPPQAPGNLAVCGNKCSGPKDCAPTFGFYACDCAFPNAEDAQVLGLDPVAPPSICLALDNVNFGLHSSLIHRDEPRYVDEEGVPYQCRCNTTYVGNECCGSRDGLVWLERGGSIYVDLI